MRAQLAQAPPAACPDTVSMSEIMHQGGLLMPELHLEQMISSLQKEKEDLGGPIRSVQEEAYLHPTFGTATISATNKNPYHCIRKKN